MQHTSTYTVPASTIPRAMDGSKAMIRKIRKPLIERKRRERINSSLEQLKQILIQVSLTDNSLSSKLEKADILELTVKYLSDLNNKRDQGSSVADSQRLQAAEYRSGYSRCANEVLNFLTVTSEVDSETRGRLSGHLSHAVSGKIPSRCTRAPDTYTKRTSANVPVTNNRISTQNVRDSEMINTVSHSLASSSSHSVENRNARVISNDQDSSVQQFRYVTSSTPNVNRCNKYAKTDGYKNTPKQPTNTQKHYIPRNVFPDKSTNTDMWRPW